jgi:hypothetical protein
MEVRSTDTEGLQRESYKKLCLICKDWKMLSFHVGCHETASCRMKLIWKKWPNYYKKSAIKDIVNCNNFPP